MREPRPDWSPLGVNFKILDEDPYLFYISSPPPPGARRGFGPRVPAQHTGDPPSNSLHLT